MEAATAEHQVKCVKVLAALWEGGKGRMATRDPVPARNATFVWGHFVTFREGAANGLSD